MFIQQVIGAQTLGDEKDEHLPPKADDVDDSLPEPSEEDSLTKLPEEDFEVGKEDMEEEIHEEEYDVHVPINVSPNKWGPKKG